MNTINLISAISVLACNVSMATIPKQANPSNYGDIISVKKDFSYNKSSSLSGDFDLDNTNYGYNVQRFIGNYSDSSINFSWVMSLPLSSVKLVAPSILNTI